MNILVTVGNSIARGSIEDAIERLLALLDTIDGDENLEPVLAGFDTRFTDDREEENEHGGDINDEPQDNDDDAEPDDDGETAWWSNDPDMPQVGRDWHGFGHDPAEREARP